MACLLPLLEGATSLDDLQHRMHLAENLVGYAATRQRELITALLQKWGYPEAAALLQGLGPADGSRFIQEESLREKLH